MTQLTVEQAMQIALQHHEAGRLSEAEHIYRQVLGFKSDVVEAHNNLANILKDQGKLAEATTAYRHAIRINPNLAEAYSNMSAALRDQGQYQDAIAASEQAIRLKPGLAEAHFNLAMLLLLMGDFARGWAEFDWRWKRQDVVAPLRQFPQRQWAGEELNGQRLLLYAEQGFGDTIQFIRYLPQVVARGAKVALVCQPELCRLLKSFPGVWQIANGRPPLPEFDVHFPLMSLPRIFGTREQSIPDSMPYIHADPKRVEVWAGFLQDSKQRVRVGLAWAGRPNHPNDKRRTLELRQFGPLASVTGMSFHSLQTGAASIQARMPGRSNPPVTDFTDRLTDFAETAALIANLDLVITVDTAVAHLTGAMGKPVWVLLPFVPDWRWMLNREDNPWYPTMRLFRQ
jgi:hypothetical protein